MRYLFAALLTFGLVVGCGNAAPPASPSAVPLPDVTSGAQPRGAGAVAPQRIVIPELGAESELMQLGLDAQNKLETPPVDQPMLAGWYTGARPPGDVGPAVIAAHVNGCAPGGLNADGRCRNGSVPGLFARLHELQPGDVAHVDRVDGSRVTFEVERVETRPKDRFPTDAVYGDLDYAGLRLITCGGEFGTTRRGHYDDNVIVFLRKV